LGDEGNDAMKKIVRREIGKIVDRIVGTILELTTLDGFMEASKTIAKTLDKVESELKDEKSIDMASAALWKSLAQVGMELFTRIWKLEAKVRSKMESQPEEATTTVLGFLDLIFEVQIRAFNSIRIQYIRLLRAKFAEAKDKQAASREAFRTALFSTVDLLGHHHWVKFTETFTDASIIIVQQGFRKEIWPPIASGLAAIQSMIPDEFGKMGLQIEPLAWSVVAMLIQKGVVWGTTKVFLKMESAIFTQESGEGGASY